MRGHLLIFLLQTFVISLVSPRAGAAIDDQDTVTVTINRNDDINGVFSFDSVLVSTKGLKFVATFIGTTLCSYKSQISARTHTLIH